MTTIVDVEDAWLLGGARFGEWIAHDEVAFYEPMVEAALLMNWESLQALPAAVRERLRQTSPEAYASLKAAVEKIRKRRG